MSRFKQKAQSATSNSFVTSGRTKVSVEDIMKRFPDKITVMEFDQLKKGNDTFYAVAIAEDPEIFFFTGSVLTQICDSWLEDYESCEEASKDLTADGGVPMKLYNAKSKSNRTYVAAEILD